MHNWNFSEREPAKGEIELRLKISRLLDDPGYRKYFVQTIVEWGDQRLQQNRWRVTLFPVGHRDLSLQECFVSLGALHDALVEPDKRPLFYDIPDVIDPTTHPWLRSQVQRESHDAGLLFEIEIGSCSKHGPSETELTVLRDAFERVHEHLRSLLPRVPRTEQSNVQAGTSDPDSLTIGPIPPDGFRWQRESPYRGLKGKAWMLVYHLWHRKDRWSDEGSMCPYIWGDPRDITEEALGSARRVANNFFREHAIPWTVTTQPHPDKQGWHFVSLVRTDD